MSPNIARPDDKIHVQISARNKDNRNDNELILGRAKYSSAGAVANLYSTEWRVCSRWSEQGQDRKSFDGEQG